MISIEGRELYLGDVIKSTCNTNSGSLSDTYEPISIKHGRLVDMTRLYSLILIWMTLTFTHATGIGES